jgi:hypothetical protein
MSVLVRRGIVHRVSYVMSPREATAEAESRPATGAFHARCARVEFNIR